MIKVLIADDHAVVRTGLAALLGTIKEFSVVGQAKNGELAVAETLRLKPDVVIMDLIMPKKDGVAATAEIHKLCPEVRILILTTFGTSDGIVHALEAGASGALMKSAEDDELVDAIRRVAAGEKVIPNDVRQLIETDPPIPQLTPRQREILESMTRGLSNKEIAQQYGIRADGVTDHVMDILSKLGAANRTEAVAIALRKQLLTI